MKVFLRAVRRRLWLEAAVQRLRAAVWAASAALALAAVVHLAWQPVSLVTAVVAALVISFLVLLPALLSRPDLTECALRADRQFGGRALLTTASEIGGSGQLRPVEETVVRRAVAASSAWQPRLDEIWQAPPRSGYVLAVVPAFFAVLLLQSPVDPDFVAATAAEDAPVPAGRVTPTAAADDADNLAALREAIMQDAADSERPTDRDRATGAAQLADGEPQPLADRVEIAEQGTGQPGFAGLSDQGGATPGDARRRPVEGDGERVAETSDMTTVASTRIERRGAAATGRDETNEAFAAGPAASEMSSLNIAPVPAPPAVSSWTTLTAAEIAYARRYLDLEDQDNE